ncbi:MAG: hypothetical protein F7B20_06885 [Aeropyrum sp.]|nr:hypothetical protein [Aeropyrum sp.]MCE4616082.1 hypothetical protein [Aeropyrum sp.]
MDVEAALTAAVIAGFVSGGLAGYAAAKIASGKALKILEALSEAGFRSRELARIRRRLGSRPRKRYIAFEVLARDDKPPDKIQLEHSLRKVYKEVFGLKALAVSRLRIVEYDEKAGRGVLEVRREYKYHALAALGLLRRAGGREVLVVPLRTSGTIKGALRAFAGKP